MPPTPMVPTLSLPSRARVAPMKSCSILKSESITVQNAASQEADGRDAGELLDPVERQLVKVPNLRIGSEAQSALTAAMCTAAPTYLRSGAPFGILRPCLDLHLLGLVQFFRRFWASLTRGLILADPERFAIDRPAAGCRNIFQSGAPDPGDIISGCRGDFVEVPVSTIMKLIVADSRSQRGACRDL